MFGKAKKEMEESKPLEKIQLKHLIIAFVILGVGCSLALVILCWRSFGEKRYIKC